MNIHADAKTAQQPLLHAALNYSHRLAERGFNYAVEPPPGTPRTNVVPDPETVGIYDGRTIDASIDREGFALFPHHSNVTDFFNEDEVKSKYYPEAARLLELRTGAARVHIFDHTTRRRQIGEVLGSGRATSGRGPVGRVHVDHTDTSGPKRLRELLGDEADQLAQRPFAIVNVWRPTRGPVEDSPLAVADARTIAPDDLIGTDLIYTQRTGETYSVAYSPQHRWYFYPHMRTDEVLFLKCYDSRSTVARFAPHTAFENPLAPPDAQPRESIELRAFVFF
ncbi:MULTISPECIES: CmcJ/NvfI family oxidoreductase [unclassified Beijerinckia]|uniref:CmcJ/NvfI family oxidoreductase n=1 Tax=unclassified Beijerinckia TaxID=2638183 RepID=UPI00089AED94|nr:MULTISPECIES: CmcJ/NvfI family oxidoreductase [unclassified Beijerinckia]MDH7798719.1 hypothetical protein [Beijerinckia sp. GAS462]SED30727.1 hypothetical protein SAMN05443249_5021 [Beijerinckia sp. 28-YEA-48]